MIYLLAKYTLLFVLATVLGFVLGHWWSRRKFVDVTESYEDLRRATEQTDAANWERLWSRFDALPEPRETDLSPVFERLDGVRNAVAGIQKPDTVDLAPVRIGIEGLSDQIARMPKPSQPKDPDLRPLTDRIGTLEQSIRAIPAPTDIGPLEERLQGLETAVRSIPAPAPQRELDLKPIDGRLRGIEREILNLDKRLARSADAKQSTEQQSIPQTKRSAQPKILSAALYGKKDDLKLISGVGPKLERLLNENGVYYFWQVASWSRKDIGIIDERLESFRGRISRDNWVSQAKQLKRSPGAAHIPTD